MNTPRLPLRIVKVGGSLLAWPELPRAIERWLEVESPAVNVLVCGGGPLTEAIRQADRDFALGEETSHWLCIDTLAVNAKLLAAAVADFPLITTYAELQAQIANDRPSAVVFDPREFLRTHESHLAGTPLPHTWQVTTDSIAARLAEVLCADELVLLKSADRPAGDLPALAAAGYVDAHFPQAALSLARVRFVNLRAP